MSHDRRLTPANSRVAAEHLRGKVEAARFVAGEPAQIVQPVVDLCNDAGRRERQLLWGARVTVFERHEGRAFVQAADGYVGYVEDAALGPAVDVTHIVGVRATHLYAAPELKAPELALLSFGARLRVVWSDATYFETADGRFVPKSHLRPANKPFADPVTVAQIFFGAPYLWGGNSQSGIDCSGLVQAAYLACGLDCPGDSDLQEAALGMPVKDPQGLRRGDLLFWKGHVALAVDADVMIHANAHHMAVAYEEIAPGIARIEAQGDGPVTSIRRV